MNFSLIAKVLGSPEESWKPVVWPHTLLDNQAEVRKAGNQESGEGLKFYERIVKEPLSIFKQIPAAEECGRAEDQTWT
jgi:hypothetical protein